ncbi:S8 family peptidase [Paenibacillus glycanilyticus]|uniref:S8 family peptidase n=1 Tax=Paenibacillus glycanilyticus TaxID=126569 RepID=UPI00203C11C3|nr:S8 family peptidase [Paenibacillus glycanilyticus]MCM3627376.1 S8 family peptidase [Paenibacillus glycanilyticus]
MPKLEKLLFTSSKRAPSKHTVRKLITFKTGLSYKKCLRKLRIKGLKPYKRMPSLRTIGCHFDKRRSWKSISKHPEVKRVESDVRIRVHLFRKHKQSANRKKAHTLSTCPPDLTWNICRVKANEAWPRTTGGKIKVAIIDTGIAAHPNLQIAGGVNTMRGGSYADDNGHGTHVAGITAAKGLDGIKGVAPDVELYAVKALDSRGGGYVSSIIAGVDWCIRNKMDVINMSFGLVGTAVSRALREVITKAYNQGIVIVASAGNSGTEDNGMIDVPASFPETIAIAATNLSNKVTGFSSRGTGIDLAAPGEQIKSTWLNGGYMTLSGTSMSAPHAAGGVALLLSRQSGLTPAQVAEQLKGWALPLPSETEDEQGAGLLQLDRV